MVLTRAGTSNLCQGDSFIFHHPVPWLPPFLLCRSVLLTRFEVANTSAHFSSFSCFRWEGGQCVVTQPDTGSFERWPSRNLIERLALLDCVGQSPSVRADRERIESVLLARRLTAKVAALAGRRFPAAAAAHRSEYLRAIDHGAPPPAGAVRWMAADVPGCLSALGHALPTREAVNLLRRHAPIIEVGAGMGLWARTMEQAGIVGVATDIGMGASIGVCGRVLKGWDARHALTGFGSVGRSVLMLWPTIAVDGWAGDVIASLDQGAVLLISSPEVDFVQDVDRRCGRRQHPDSPPLAQARRILRTLGDCFELLDRVPLATAAPDRLDMRLHAYRRVRSRARRRAKSDWMEFSRGRQCPVPTAAPVGPARIVRRFRSFRRASARGGLRRFPPRPEVRGNAAPLRTVPAVPDEPPRWPAAELAASFEQRPQRHSPPARPRHVPPVGARQRNRSEFKGSRALGAPGDSQ
jgi:hypothetical protein